VAEPGPSALVVEFASRLRERGLLVPVGSVLAFSEALSIVGLENREEVYWAARATLTTHLEDQRSFDIAFAEVFAPGPRSEMTRTVLLEMPEDEASEESHHRDLGEQTKRRSYSRLERLRTEDFSRYSPSDWDEASRLMSELGARPQTRRSRRLRPSSKRDHLDLERTVRSALRHDGEAMLDSYKAPTTKLRRLVFLIDISGSMEPYARAFLRLAHAAGQAHHGGVETFVIGTRVTRVTEQLAWRDPEAALRQAGEAAQDWYGGTRLGDGLKFFIDRWGQKGLARGAVVVILSDGWDRGDPRQLGAQMRRLSRLCFRSIWVNPLRATAGYEPIAAGMAAALPFVDDFVDGHSLAALEQLLFLITDPRRPRRRASIDLART
jgi:uncharacterized protein with von Willebrand factor type A (vWA) domain